MATHIRCDICGDEHEKEDLYDYKGEKICLICMENLEES